MAAAAPSPFIGRRVRLSLTNGGAYTGAITELDPTTRAIQIRDDRTTAVFTIRGDEVRDMQLLDEPVASTSRTTLAPAASAQPQAKSAPANNLPQPTSSASPSLTNRQVSQPHSQEHTAAGKAGKKKSISKKEKQKQAAAAAAATSSSTAHANTSRDYAHTSEASDKSNKLAFQEDFDFEGALKTFDKAKIWDEIRRADQTDPDTLLVSHNRAGPTILKRGPNGVGPATAVPAAKLDSADEEDSGQNDGSPRLSKKRPGAAKSRANAQKKLGINEMVLSEDEDDADASKPLQPLQQDAGQEAVPTVTVDSTHDIALDATADKATINQSGEGLLNSLMASAAARMSGFASAARTAIGGSPASPSALHPDATNDDDDDDSILIPPIRRSSSQAQVQDTTASSPSQVAGPPAEASATSESKATVELREEISRLLERISVLEALGGVEIRESNPAEVSAISPAPAPNSRNWTCTVRAVGPGEPSGRLSFGLATTVSNAQKVGATDPVVLVPPKLKALRYLGALPAPDHSEAAVREALPAKYSNPMGLGVDSAGVFVRRLRDSVYGPGR